MSESPIRQGQNSHLCQFQAFLIQMFVPADALWNLAMAMNVYLTLFKKYNAQQLKAQEWKYFLMCYGATFVIAFVLIFVDTPGRGRVYGSAVLWCWISGHWDFLRVVVCYGPAWVCIVVSLSIYLLAGRFIFQKRHQLRAFNAPVDDLPFPSYDPSTIKVTKEFASLPSSMPTIASDAYAPKDKTGRFSDMTSKSYTVNVSSRPALPHKMSNGGIRRNRATMEANRAAYNYTKIASLFFVSLLVTWVPSSINRVYSLIHPESVSVEYAYAAGIVLSLMGFWNSVIYISTSHHACKVLFDSLFRKSSCVADGSCGMSDGRGSLAMRSRGRASWGDSVEGLAHDRASAADTTTSV
ncbi:hypothetical protein N7G274_004225 [Stereocaulon virgatum]|uniref:G-protein coupled receptors family 2 profile 2 domain-containing protein n=1 Tax=Stereocaulon virgatum TaxID=373712 RepID=A0ABR4ACD5_9LECA